MFDNLPVTIDDYTFVEKLGHGGTAKVFRATSSRYNIDFAIKVMELQNNNTPCYDAEISALLRLDHPNIIKMYQYFRKKGHLFIVYELCKRTLEDELKEKNISNQRLEELFFEIVHGLHYCHSLKICHRDIKSTNILIDSFGHAKLADFGLSMILQDYDHISTYNGSIAYAAPEVINHIMHNPFCADIWSFGVLIYYMWTRTYPWPMNNVEQTIKAIKACNYSIPILVPKRIKIFIHKMLVFDPEQRIGIGKLITLDIANQSSEKARSGFKTFFSSEKYPSNRRKNIQQSRINSSHSFNLIPAYSFSSMQKSERKEVDI